MLGKFLTGDSNCGQRTLQMTFDHPKMVNSNGNYCTGMQREFCHVLEMQSGQFHQAHEGHSQN